MKSSPTGYSHFSTVKYAASSTDFVDYMLWSIMFILEENTRLLFFIFPEWRLVIGFK